MTPRSKAAPSSKASKAEDLPAPSKRLRQNAASFECDAVIAGRFVIRSRIGSGGMGIVYAATEIETGRDVAIKALTREAFTKTNLRRFRREAQTATSVKHRSLCEVFYLGVEAGTPFIVMERLQGETLRERVLHTGPLSATDAVSVMIQVLDGLAAAHAAGVLHRDIKPANIFFTTPRGAPPKIKIIDFGLAKGLPTSPMSIRPPKQDEGHSTITTTDVVPGTPQYLAPEQVAGARDLDERVDIWAAGLLFYEILVGRRAYEGASYAALATSILLRPPPPLSSIRADVPNTFDDVLRTALAKDREARFPSAGAFRAALVEAWARFRTKGVERHEQLRKFRGEALTLPARDEIGGDDATEIDVDVEFDPDG
jgi:eukaryotic-like serine/threonine-protein kinase